MKRKQAEYPFDSYWLYEVFHKKKGRWQVNLINKLHINERTTLSRARYRYSVYLGRIIEDEYQVDHIDNDKQNDTIENLQLLTLLENKKKQEELHRSNFPKFKEMICKCCGKEFQIFTRNYNFHTKRGRIKFSCSRKCAATKLD